MSKKPTEYVQKYCKFHEKECTWTSKGTTCIQRRNEVREEFLKKITIPEEKSCNVCNEIKPSIDFDKDNTVKCGLKASCKQCVKERDYKKYNSWEGYVQKKVVASWSSHNNNDKENKLSVETALQMLKEQEYRCLHCHHELECIFGTQEKRNCWGASLDRIDTTIMGYGGGNSQWLCTSCNNGKCTMDNNEHKEKFARRDRRIKELEEEVKKLRNQLEQISIE